MTRLASYRPIALLALVAACGGDPGSGPRGEAGLETSAGEVSEAIVQAPSTRRLGVLLLHYGEPGFWTPEYFERRLFTDPDSVSAFYAESSFGALNLTGDVFDWIQTVPTSECDISDAQIRDNGLAAAQAAGIDLSSYDHVLFVLNDFCRGGGSANLGTPNTPARYSVYWGVPSNFVFIHELGHNLGLFHSQAWDCNPAILDLPASCNEFASKDPYDPMGEYNYHFNAYNKAQQGWLAGCNVVTATSSGSFTLMPLETPSALPQTLRIPAPSEYCPNIFTTPCYYYLEYREPFGFDAPLAGTPPTQGVTIRLAPDIDHAQGHSSYLVDMTPRPPGATQSVYFDAPLLVGQTFTDPSGITITPTSNANGQLEVEVQVPNGTGQPSCLGGASACSDGVRDGLESDVDCGGSCDPCETGKACSTASDCSSGNCSAGVCESSRVTASFAFSSNFGNGYCGELTIRNASNTLVTDWRVDVDLHQSTPSSFWNSVFSPTGGSQYAVTPAAWNRQITPGNAVGVGFCATKTGQNYTPEVLSASSP
jgi:hypothetical protein